MRVISPEEKNRAVEALKAGGSIRGVARELGLNRETVKKYHRELGIKTVNVGRKPIEGLDWAVKEVLAGTHPRVAAMRARCGVATIYRRLRQIGKTDQKLAFGPKPRGLKSFRKDLADLLEDEAVTSPGMGREDLVAMITDLAEASLWIKGR